MSKIGLIKKNLDEQEFQHQFSKEFGMLPPMGSSPDGFKEALEWAEAKKKQLGLDKIN